MDASCFIQASIHGLSYFIVSRILGTYQCEADINYIVSKESKIDMIYLL